MYRTIDLSGGFRGHRRQSIKLERAECYHSVTTCQSRWRSDLRGAIAIRTLGWLVLLALAFWPATTRAADLTCADPAVTRAVLDLAFKQILLYHTMHSATTGTGMENVRVPRDRLALTHIRTVQISSTGEIICRGDLSDTAPPTSIDPNLDLAGAYAKPLAYTAQVYEDDPTHFELTLYPLPP